MGGRSEPREGRRRDDALAPNSNVLGLVGNVVTGAAAVWVACRVRRWSRCAGLPVAVVVPWLAYASATIAQAMAASAHPVARRGGHGLVSGLAYVLAAWAAAGGRGRGHRAALRPA